MAPARSLTGRQGDAASGATRTGEAPGARVPSAPHR
ncbi:hypothetical protein SFR_1474 [Streptomyces sp. FR-008]|nr:hypothetical protein SFR_1474 [Streptomyces sp. FR-008]